MKNLNIIFGILLILNGLLAHAKTIDSEILKFGHSNSGLSNSVSIQLRAVLNKSKHHTIESISVLTLKDPNGHSIYQTHVNKKRIESVRNYFSLRGISPEQINVEYLDSASLNKYENLNITALKNGYLQLLVEYVESIPESFLVTSNSHNIDAETASSLKIDNKGTTMHIPENCFVDENGNPVKGVVQIEFKEYTNPAEIAFSGIPMTYQGFNFNSAGMFEIQGKCQGKNVSIAKNKEIKIDYALAKENPDIDFYKLKEDGKGWEKVQEIGSERLSTSTLTPDNINRNQQINSNNWNNYNYNNNTRNQKRLATTESMKAYSNIVGGLRVANFGVYNCDQVYRLKNQIKVSPKFVDQNGKKIENASQVSLIDLKINGAFSFSPTSFTCNSKADNVLAMFTTTGKLYLLEKDQFKATNMTVSGDYTLKMKDMSKQIKNHQDLASYLNLL